MNSETKVKQRPILFSTEMVRAILQGRKTVTRRIIKPQPIFDADSGYVFSGDHKHSFKNDIHHEPWQNRYIEMLSPYGKVGDVLWVREEHYRFGHWEPMQGVRTKQGRQKWAFIPDTGEVLYFDNPPAEFRKGRHHKDPGTPAWHKRLARFMPKDLCRTFLQITDIRVERLKDISEEDAISEGIQYVVSDLCRGYNDYAALKNNKKLIAAVLDSPRQSFRSLWESINGSESWNLNPWVWCVSFDKIDKQE